MLGAVTRRLPAGLQVCEALQGDNIPQRQIQTLAGQRNVNRQPHKALKDQRRTVDSCYPTVPLLMLQQLIFLFISKVFLYLCNGGFSYIYSGKAVFCFEKRYNHFRYT